MRGLSIFVTTLALTAFGCDSSDSGTKTSTLTNVATSTLTNTLTNTVTSIATTNGRSMTSGGKCPGDTSATCAELTTYQICQSTKCAAELKQAFGAGFMTGDFTGGGCAEMMDCTMKCPCDATGAVCEQGCGAKIMQGTCLADITALGSCGTTSCGVTPTCGATDTNTATSVNTATLTNTSTGTTALGAKCQALGLCCSSLATAGAAATTLLISCGTTLSTASAAGAAGETTCGTQMDSIKAAGFCK